MSALQNPPCIPIAAADAAGFFPSALEYNTPARGMWNIVHMGMLVPEAHQIYLCAQGCLRGVVLTAAEMNALDRMSWVSVSEEDIIDGSLERDIYEGVRDILADMEKKPRAVLIFISCMHLFSGVDFAAMLELLRADFPAIDFMDCYMAPTMRRAIAPIVWLNMQMYALLKPRQINPHAAAIIGCDRPTDPQSELVRLIQSAGFALHDITRCDSYDAFRQIAESALLVSYIPAGYAAAAETAKRFGAKHLHLPASFDYDDIAANYRLLCDALGIPCPDFAAEIAAAKSALQSAYDEIGDMPVAIDFTAVTQPFSLAKLLCEAGFRVTAIIADAAGEDAAAFRWLQENRSSIALYAATNVNMLHMSEHAPETPVLAIGQKAAYYFSTDYFVNTVMNGGYYGFAGICAMADQMREAARIPKDRKRLLSHKGFGCESCLAG